MKIEIEIKKEIHIEIETNFEAEVEMDKKRNVRECNFLKLQNYLEFYQDKRSFLELENLQLIRTENYSITMIGLSQERFVPFQSLLRYRQHSLSYHARSIADSGFIQIPLNLLMSILDSRGQSSA